MVNVKPVQLGKNTRMSFSHINEVLDMPNLIEIQKNSYDWFLKEGLKEVFDDVSGITDFNGNLVLDFVNYKLDEKPNYTVTECKERDATYAAALRVTARLLNKETGEIKESEVFMGDFPLMTPSGTFVINGAERVIVSQLVRSPGVYYKMEYDKTGKQLFSSTVIPNRGAWLEYENDVNDVLYVRIDKNRKLPMTAFIRALGLGTDEEIKEYFGEDERILATIDKDTTHTMEEGLFEVYRKLRPSEPPTVESAQFHLNGLFFDPRRYDLSRVGRYKYNKKLNLAGRITGRQLSRPIVNPATGEVMAEAGTVVSRTLAEDIDNAGVTTAWVALEDDKETKVISNGMVDIAKYVSFDAEAECGINERVRYAVLSEILEECGDDEEKLKEQLTARHDELIPNHIIIDDIFSSINYMTCLAVGLGFTDDIGGIHTAEHDTAVLGQAADQVCHRLFLQLCILLDCAEEIALAVLGQRAEGLAVADAFQRKAVLFQRGADGVKVVGVLVELLVEVLAGLVVVDVHGDLHPAVLRVVVVAPDAGRIFFLKGEFVVTQHVLVLIGGVHVKEEHAALLHKEACVGNGRVQIRDVVEGVKG